VWGGGGGGRKGGEKRAGDGGRGGGQRGKKNKKLNEVTSVHSKKRITVGGKGEGEEKRTVEPSSEGNGLVASCPRRVNSFFL